MTRALKNPKKHRLDRKNKEVEERPIELIESMGVSGGFLTPVFCLGMQGYRVYSSHALTKIANNYYNSPVIISFGAVAWPQ